MALFGTSKKDLSAELDSVKNKLQESQNQINSLKKTIRDLKAKVSPDFEKAEALRRENELLETQKFATESLIAQAKEELQTLIDRTTEQKKQLEEAVDDVKVQEYGLYKPTFVFANSDAYKDKLKEIRENQKIAIKNGVACTGSKRWSINNSWAEGEKMIRDMKKLLLKAFNSECDELVDKVKISNFEKSKERIYKSCEQISKLGRSMNLSIMPHYRDLKIAELSLALDFQQKKEEEKERIRELKALQREEAKAQKEIEEAQKKLRKERAHYENALASIKEQLSRNPNDVDLLEKQRALETDIEETDKAIQDVDYREVNKRAGYVYIISNIGAFGENVYKIGMTRRLDPLERVDELGDASVPFKFDVHALIFTEDAPSLEAALHKAFEDRKVNKINQRREFFRVSLNEIKQVVRQNFDKTVEWVDVPEAEQYRQTLAINSVEIGDRS